MAQKTLEKSQHNGKSRPLPHRCQTSPSVELHARDCREALADMDDSSVHMVLTDPPYFLDRLDDGWNQGKIKHSQSRA